MSVVHFKPYNHEFTANFAIFTVNQPQFFSLFGCEKFTALAIITKLDQNIKQLELYTNCRIWAQNFGTPQYL